METRPTSKRKSVSTKGTKAHFLQKFPTSTVALLLQTLPDSMDVEEFIGAIGVLLNQLDRERAKKLSDRINIKEVV